MGNKVIIVGGVAGGASAAARLRRIDEHAEIIMLERGEYISFANCGLPYYIGDVINKRSHLLVQTPAAMKERFNIDIRVFNEAVKINTEVQTVEIRDVLTNKVYEENYDKLIIATGSSPIKPPIPGIDSKNIHTIWDIPDTDTIKAHMTRDGIRKAVIVGGGFIGIEMAENFCEIGIDVTLLEMQDQVMGPLDRDMAQYVHKELVGHGVDLRLGTQVVRFADDEGKTSVYLKDGQCITADIVIMAAGIRPNSELARVSGIALNERGYIKTNEFLQTSNEHIYAVGDVVEVADFVSGNKTILPLAGPANKQGRIAADNVCGGNVIYNGVQGTSVLKVFDLTISSTGLNEKGLQHSGKKLHVDYEVVYGHGTNHASYYPNSSTLHTKMIFDRKDGRILGAQAVGKEGTEKRIDVLATAIRYKGIISDLTQLDLAYAPPFNTAKDPVNFLGYMGENILEGLVDVIQWHELGGLPQTRYQLVDVRQPEEYAEGDIPGATLIPLPEVRNRLSEFDKEKTIVVYCKAGLRSYIAARILTQAGYQVKSVPGGWTTYETATWE